MADENSLSFVKDVLPALGPVGSIASGILGFFGQKSSNKQYLQGVRDTNATNLAIARETNKQNLDMFNAANAFSEKMWNKTNAYNDPAAVRARLIRAGISPSAMAEGGSASSVQSVSGSPSIAARLEAPGLVPSSVQDLARSVGGAVNDYYQNAMMREQLKQSRYSTYMQSLDADYYLNEKSNNILRQMKEIDSLNLSNADKMKRLDYLERQLDAAYQLQLKSMRAADDEHDNAVRTGHEIDSRVAMNYSTIERNLAEIHNMSVMQAVSWFNAHSQRKISDASAENLQQQSRNLSEELRQSKANFSADSWYRNNKYAIDQLDYDAKTVLVSQMQQELQALVLQNQLNADKAEGFLNDFCRQVLGVDLEHVFSGGMFMPVSRSPSGPRPIQGFRR